MTHDAEWLIPCARGEVEHQFPEEQTPEGVRILLPCLGCGLAAADGLAAVQRERDDLAARVGSGRK